MAFAVDITPKRFALLGFAPTQPQPLFGAPLFRPKSAGPRNSVQPPPVLASCDGPVYAGESGSGAMDKPPFAEPSSSSRFYGFSSQ